MKGIFAEAVTYNEKLRGRMEGNAPQCTCFAYDYTEDSITIYGYLDSTPIDEVITEIMASLPNILFQEIVLINTTAPVSELILYKGWFYIRKE